MLNPFKIAIVVALVIAIVAAVGFVLIVFVQNGGHGASTSSQPSAFSEIL